MPTDNPTKVCRSCKEAKPTSEFYPHDGHKDGLSSYCHKCTLQRRAIRYRSGHNRQLKAEYDKRANQTERRKLQRRAAMRRWRSRNKQSVEAHMAVRWAVYFGILPPLGKTPCGKCGQPSYQYHHTNGMEEPHWIDVVPLCKTCHLAAHRKQPVS
jgi:hypothetical protein